MRRQPRNTSSHRFKNVRRSSGVPRLTGWHTIWHIETRTYNDLAQSEKKNGPRDFCTGFPYQPIFFVTYKIFILLLHLYNKLLSSCCADVTRSFVLQRNKEKRELEKLWERTTHHTVMADQSYTNSEWWGYQDHTIPPHKQHWNASFCCLKEENCTVIHNQSLFQASLPDTSSYQGYIIMDR